MEKQCGGIDDDSSANGSGGREVKRPTLQIPLALGAEIPTAGKRGRGRPKGSTNKNADAASKKGALQSRSLERMWRVRKDADCASDGREVNNNNNNDVDEPEDPDDPTEGKEDDDVFKCRSRLTYSPAPAQAVCGGVE